MPSSLPYVHTDSMVINCTSKDFIDSSLSARTLGYVTKKAGKNILEDDRELTYYSQFKALRELMGTES